ncbi:transposase, MuDR, MULE transposase domain protein [Tanacetum coccineum]
MESNVSFKTTHLESFRVDDLDLDLNLTLDLNVSQIKTQEEVPVSEVPNKEHVVVHVRVVDVVDGSGEEAVVHDSDEEAVEQGNGEEAVEQGNGEEAIKQGNGEEVVKETSGEQVEYDVVGIDSAYETQYYVESGDDAGTDDDDDFLVDKEIEIVEPDVDVHLFDVVNADGFNSDIGYDDETSTYRRRSGPTGPNQAMGDGPSRSSGLTTRSTNRKNVALALQDQLQNNLELQVSMKNEFRAKVKSEREVKGDHTLQYAMLRDYVVELQSTNLNTTVKNVVERNIDPSLPTRVFKRIYGCLGALKLRFRACKRELLGLHGAFMKGPFPCQVLVTVGLDLKNRIYPFAYALVEAESKSSLSWFLQCLGDDIDLQLNLNFAFIIDRQKGIIPAIKSVFPIAKHILLEIHT